MGRLATQPVAQIQFPHGQFCCLLVDGVVNYSSGTFLPEGAACCQSAFPPSRPAEDHRAAGAGHHRVGMAEDGGDPIATNAFDIHEVGVGALHQPLLLVFPPLLCITGVHQILRLRHVCFNHPRCSVQHKTEELM